MDQEVLLLKLSAMVFVSVVAVVVVVVITVARKIVVDGFLHVDLDEDLNHLAVCKHDLET